MHRSLRSVPTLKVTYDQLHGRRQTISAADEVQFVRNPLSPLANRPVADRALGAEAPHQAPCDIGAQRHEDAIQRHKDGIEH